MNEHLREIVETHREAEKARGDTKDYIPGSGRPRHVRRAEKRATDLLRLVPKDGKCPICRKIVTSSRSWVLKKHIQFQAICRSCWFKHLETRKEGKK